MTAITRTSPLNLGEVRRTQRRVAALMNASDFCCCCHGRRRRFPTGYCYVCSQLDGRRRGFGPNNPYRHLFSKGYLRPCPHLPPLAPHPTLIGSDDEVDFADDGFDEGSFDMDGSDDGGMFDTKILRDDSSQDPTAFSLPPVFNKKDSQQDDPKPKRQQNKKRVVPVVSENTFLSTEKRLPRTDTESTRKGSGSDLHLPALSSQRSSFIAAEVTPESQGDGKRKLSDPRRLNSERMDRKVSGLMAEKSMRSDSAIGLTKANTGMSREKTDPPPQPIVVSIKNQDGEDLQRVPLSELSPGAIPTEAFVEQEHRKSRKKREKKRRSRSRTDSVSPTFSGSITISRETTLSGLDSPDYFLNRLRSASWCECPDHRASESRCGECRRVNDHEKWCVSRNTICQNCSKPFKRKYSQLERKSSFSTIQASGGNASHPASSGSPTRNHHQNCSPAKTADPSISQPELNREASGNRVRFHEDGKVVYPQWETFPDSGIEDDKEQGDKSKGKQKKEKAGRVRLDRKAYAGKLDANIHQRAYNLALADAKLRAMFPQSRKSKGGLHHPDGVYFSYFPLLKRKKRHIPAEISVSPTPPNQTIGLRADVREGKQLKVKKGLKHIFGDIKVEDYYPGGKSYPTLPAPKPEEPPKPEAKAEA